MHNPKATANALTTVGAVLYLVCAAWVMIARNSFMGFFNNWAHSIDMSALPTKTPELSGVIIGLVTFTIATWTVGYMFAVTYNYFSSKK